MVRHPLPILFASLLLLISGGGFTGLDARQVTSPVQEFGQSLGDDYFLATYEQLVPYWQKLARESDRMRLDTIGMTSEGRPQLMAILTSPANHENLDRYREIARQMALGRVADEAEALRLADEGRAVVWFDGGLHATELLGAQQLMETVYQLVSRNDAETLRILDDVVILAVHANPDGHDLVAGQYMRNPVPEQRSTGGIPVLYQKYAGHDNNRDFFASHLIESENMNVAMYRTWFPQIVYNHHQSGPAGTVLFAPPFRDPFNYNIDPLVIVGIDRVGSAMHERFVREGKPGATMRSGAGYSTWWNGGLRTTPYFHNMIGLLTETIGHPTPQQIPFITSRQIPHGDMPAPIEPQRWHFRSSVDYSVTANYAVFDYASRQRDQLLFNIWRMARNAIERGERDSWTVTYRTVERAREEMGGNRGGEEEFRQTLRRPEDRDPRGYVLPSDQPDFLTAAKFMESLLENGVEVRRATRAFSAGGRSYPAGSFVVPAAQAFAPHVFDMFEPQEHPDDIPFPGADPIAPYDATGWTLAYTTGVEFDRLMEGFDCPCEVVEGSKAPIPEGRVADSSLGWFLDHRVNDSFVALNRLLAGGHEVHWLGAPVQAGGATLPNAPFFVPAGDGVRAVLDGLARDKGLVFEEAAEMRGCRNVGGQRLICESGLDGEGAAQSPADAGTPLRPVRVGLVDRFGGSMPAGWTRLILEDFEFPYNLVFPQELDAGNLIDRYDALVFVTGMIPGNPGAPSEVRIPAGLDPEYHDRVGSVSRQTIDRLREFLEAGGTVLTIGSSTVLARHLDLPVADHMVGPGGQRYARGEFYTPGSVLRVRVDNTLPAAHGMKDEVDVLFDNSPVFSLPANAEALGIRPIAWFDSPAPLRSGWAWGQDKLEGGVAAVEARVGEGTLYLFGPEIAFRAQPHGTFKFLFNGIFHGAANRN